MAVPAAFQLAKQLRQAPKKIAAELADGDRRRSPASPRWRWPATATSTSASTAAPMRRPAARRERGRRRSRTRRSSSSTPTSIPTRRRTSATCATPTLGDTFVRMLRARRQARRSAELHRQHRRAGGRRGGGLPLPGEEDAWPMCRRCWPTRPCASTITAGISTRARRSYYKDHPESLRMAQRDAARHRSGRGRSRRTGAPGGRRHRQGAPGDHAAAGRGVRRAAARERDPAPEILGLGVRAAQGAQGDLLRDRRQERGLLGDARASPKRAR